MVISRSSVPDVRSRSVAIEVIRNISRNGKMPSSAGAIRENSAAESNTYRSSTISSVGTATSSTTVRGSCLSWRSTRPAVAITPGSRLARGPRGRRPRPA